MEVVHITVLAVLLAAGPGSSRGRVEAADEIPTASEAIAADAAAEDTPAHF